MITVVVADDQDLVRAGLRMILEAAEDITVVADAGNGQEAVVLASRLHPDVVLMDIRMPKVDGIQATQRLMERMHQAPRILVLTTFDEDEIVHAALRAGAAGFLLKSAPPARLIEAVRCIHAGEALLAPSITRRLIETHLKRREPSRELLCKLDDLTAREHEVLTLVGRGLSNHAIAGALTISEATVKTHINRLFAKLGINDRVGAVVFAYEAGVLEPGEAGPTHDA